MSDPLSAIMSVAGGALFGQLFGKPEKAKEPPPPAAPASEPTGSPNSNKPKQMASFVSQAAPPSQQQSRGGATLLGQ